MWLTFDLKIVILHALLAVSMPNILVVIFMFLKFVLPNLKYFYAILSLFLQIFTLILCGCAVAICISLPPSPCLPVPNHLNLLVRT